MSSSKLLAFQAKIAKKVSEITYKDTELPKSAIDVLSAFKSASQVKTSTSNTYRIDLCPDFTPCFLYLLLSAKADTPALEQANNPKVSRYTYVAYQMHLIYIWFLLHDLYISPGTSVFAESLITDKHFADIIEDTLDYPVPPAVINVISFWSTTCLENQKNIWITPSFNNYLHYTHFGRSFPVSILFAAHNVIAENSANAKVPDLLYEFATTPLYRIMEFVPAPVTAPNTRRATTYTPDKYFSLLRPDATNNAIPAPVETKVNQILRAFLNFDSIKGMKAKSPFAPIPIVATKHSEPNGYLNPYVMLTSLTVANSAELGTVYDSVKAVILLQKLANTNLAACFTSVASSGALNHGTSDFPTPHWDIHPANTIADPANAVSKIRSTPLATHQTSIAFKVRLVPNNAADWNNPPTWTRRILDMLPLRLDLILTPALPHDITRLDAVLTSGPADQDAAIVPLHATNQSVNMLTLPTPGTDARFTEIPQATDNTDVTDITNADIDNFPTGPLKQFDEHNDTYPAVKVIMPQGSDSDSAHLVTLRGLIIYSEDITSSSVPQLTSRSEVYDDNAQFLQSAIPFIATHLAIHFKSNTAQPSRSTRVTPSTSTTQAAVSMLRSTHAVYMPRIERNTFTLGLTSLIPGLTQPAVRTRIPAFSQTFLGHQVVTRASTNARHIASRPANTPTGHLLVWSPYTFRAPSFQVELEDETDRTPVADVLQATYYLVNLRTLFGTSQTVYEVASPIRALPSV